MTDVWAPYGGYPKIVRQDINDNYLPRWLQAANYNTYYSGKLWNHHTVEYYNQPYAGGFNGSDFLLDPHTYQYLECDHDSQRCSAGQLCRKILARSYHQEPWFLVHAPIAPHGSVDLTPKFFSDAPKYAD